MICPGDLVRPMEGIGFYLTPRPLSINNQITYKEGYVSGSHVMIVVARIQVSNTLGPSDVFLLSQTGVLGWACVTNITQVR